ncbi:MAG: hypothetical protein RL732_208 [Bacteroidota bacterium]
MKLMLERGAVFGSGGPDEFFTPEMENAFLRHIIDLEKRMDDNQLVTIFERIGCPNYFLPAADVPDSAIDSVWEGLIDHLEENQIRLVVCTPYVSTRELYRFAVEEFFKVEIEAYDPPGVVSVFYYDFFHPDPFYENPERAKLSCIPDLFRTVKREDHFYMKEEGIQFNEHCGLTLDEYMQHTAQFRSAFDRIELGSVEDTECKVSDRESIVRGHYRATGFCGPDEHSFSGQWTVVLEPDEEHYYWYVKKVMVEGMKWK